MQTVEPVRAFRYRPEVVGDLAGVVAPPYDVITPRQQQELHERHPDNVIRLDLALQLPTDDDTRNRYTRSREELLRLLRQGSIAQDAAPAFYVYDQTFLLPDGRTVTRRGVIGRRRIEDDDSGIRAHERTLEGPKEDRFRLFRATHVACSQVFTFYTDPERQVETLLETPGVLEPLARFTTPDGVVHTLGRVTSPEAIARISEVLSGVVHYIADGHHRFETFRNYRRTRLAETSQVTGQEPWQFASVFMANTAQEGLVILPIHRLVHGLTDCSWPSLWASLQQECTIQAVEGDAQAAWKALQKVQGQGPAFAWKCRDASWQIVRPTPEAHQAFCRTSGLPRPVAELDVSWLHEKVFRERLGITREAQAAQTHLDYCHSPAEVEEALRDHPEYQAAVMLNPVQVSQIEAVAAAGERMPQKSTFFYPKILTGVVIHPLEEEIP
ncbi:MAG TPA: DUF1015 domain-containing protein [Myxococcota bacterium]|nr:DUF1015 domain-containing protein [Myxococcota bacterium]HQK51087.1 DUF1015 domain-containing protein [Myxococcota bacterium]